MQLLPDWPCMAGAPSLSRAPMHQGWQGQPASQALSHLMLVQMRCTGGMPGSFTAWPLDSCAGMQLQKQRRASPCASLLHPGRPCKRKAGLPDTEHG